MVNEVYENTVEHREAHLTTIVKAARELYSHRLVRILDLATGPDYTSFNPSLVQRLAGIDFELVLTDISPVRFREGYRKLEETLSPEQLRKIKCVLADGNRLRKPIKVASRHYPFLVSKHPRQFANNSFDIVMGNLPYGSMADYTKAIRESVRILRASGYHIVREWQVEEISDVERTPAAMRGSQMRHVDNVVAKLDKLMKPITLLTNFHQYEVNYYDPDEMVQNGDKLKDVVIVHQKENLGFLKRLGRTIEWK